MFSLSFVTQPRVAPLWTPRPAAALASAQSAPKAWANEGRPWSVACAAVAAAVLARRKPDPNRPKRPLSSYMHFLSDFRAQNKDKLDGRDIISKAAGEWRKMGDKEKKPYESKAAKDKASYDKKYKKYVESGKKDFWERDPNRPRRPPPATALFARTQKGLQPGTELGNAWNALSAKQQQKYKNQFAKSMAAYRKAMEKYKASGSEEKWKKKVGIKDIENELEALKEEENANAQALRDKLKARKEKAKAKALKEKEKEIEKAKALKEKEKAKALKEKQKTKALKEKAKLKAAREKENKKLNIQREKAKLKARKEKEKAKALKEKEKEKEKAKALKEKGKAKALKEKQKTKALKEKAKLKAEREREKTKIKIQREKAKLKAAKEKEKAKAKKVKKTLLKV